MRSKRFVQAAFRLDRRQCGPKTLAFRPRRPGYVAARMLPSNNLGRPKRTRIAG